ncbi:MAG: archease [Candidatus Undinarchaeales archaeon]
MTYKFLEHESEEGILGIGETKEEAFQEGAKGLFSLMAEIDKIEPKKEIKIECSASGVAELFVEFLNELIAQKDISELLLSEFSVEIEKGKDESGETEYNLKGTAKGEKLDQEKHQVKTIVKAATYYGMKYEKKNNKHYVQCVVDV